MLGDLAAVDDGPRSATVVAIDPVSVLRVEADAFTAILRTRPEVTYALLLVMNSRLRLANLRRVQLGEMTIAQRVAGILTELAADHGTVDAERITVTVPFGQDDLAQMVGGSREAVVRALRSLRAERIVATGRRRITILQPESLADRAG